MKNFLNYFASKMILLNVLQSINLNILFCTVLKFLDMTNQTSLCCITSQNAFLASVNQIENKFLNGYLSRLFNLLFSAQ